MNNNTAPDHFQLKDSLQPQNPDRSPSRSEGYSRMGFQHFLNVFSVNIHGSRIHTWYYFPVPPPWIFQFWKSIFFRLQWHHPYLLRFVLPAEGQDRGHCFYPCMRTKFL